MENLYEKIYSHDTVYVPPHAEHSALLEVQLGCSWGKCTFCDFARDPFVVHPLKKVESYLRILSSLQPNNEYIFLLGENVLGLPAAHLNKIIDLVNRHMPRVRFFSMYARISDILEKSQEELDALRERGVYALHIGVESGSDPILLARKKGITSADTVKALHKLDAANISYFLTIIPGLGGRAFSSMHALETARMLNRVHPANIWCLKLKLWENTPLYNEAKMGLFDEMTPKEILFEERLLLRNLEVRDCLFEDTTVLNTYTLQGRLPEQKEQLLDAMDYLLLSSPD